MAYEGKVKCPRSTCSSMRPGTNTIATSMRYIEFKCPDCGLTFRVKADLVSPLSAKLRRLNRALTPQGKEER